MTSIEYQNKLLKKYYAQNVFNKTYYSGISKLVNESGHRLLEKKLTRKNKFNKILEIGATHGQHRNFIKHQFNEYVMVDIKLPENIKELKSKNIQFYEINAENIDEFPKIKFDRIIATCILHHLKNPIESLKKWITLMNDEARMDILIPCEPTFIWNIGRNLIVKPKLKKLGINAKEYSQIINIEHINKYDDLMKELSKLKIKYKLEIRNWPFKFLPWYLNIYTRFTLIKSINKRI